MTFTEAMDDVAKAFEGPGAAVLVLGLLLSLAMSGRVWRRTRQGREAYRTLRFGMQEPRLSAGYEQARADWKTCWSQALAGSNPQSSALTGTNAGRYARDSTPAKRCRSGVRP